MVASEIVKCDCNGTLFVKSTFARALAREAVAGGLSVKVADLDVQQGTRAVTHTLRV
jgi:hypothetical protein